MTIPSTITGSWSRSAAAGSTDGGEAAAGSSVAGGLPDTTENAPALIIAILALAAGIAMVRTGRTTRD